MDQEALQPLQLITRNGTHLDLAVAQPVVEMHTFVHTGNARMAATKLPAAFRQELRNPAVKIPLPALFPLHLLMPRAVVVVSGRGAGPFGPATASIGAHRPRPFKPSGMPRLCGSANRINFFGLHPTNFLDIPAIFTLDGTQAGSTFEVTVMST